MFVHLFFLTSLQQLASACPQISGLVVTSPDHPADAPASNRAFSSTPTQLRIFGCGLGNVTAVAFASREAEPGADCQYSRTSEVFDLSLDAPTSGVVDVLVGMSRDVDFSIFYLCYKVVSENNSTKLIHAGTSDWTSLVVVSRPPTHLLPLWLLVTLISLLLVFSGLFSGLNLGLMSLDVTELNILVKCGTKREKKHAKKILPLRKRGNFLLCTILLGNVLVNNTLAILLDDLTGSGIIAVIGATIAIVIFGEIIPQAICSRYGLQIGAYTIWFTKFFMVLTFPLAYPIGKLLDKILGKEVGYNFNRARLKELLKLKHEDLDLEKDEIDIISGALELSSKFVVDIMTSLSDIYMVEYNQILNFETITGMLKTGYTRIPVYEGSRTNIVSILNIKDLALIDPDHATPLKILANYYNHPLTFVNFDTSLDVVLKEFKKGRSHMAFVQRPKGSKNDSVVETIGLVTLEDVLEEIIQSEIIDETDTIIDNQNKLPRKCSLLLDYNLFKRESFEGAARVSSHVILATYQYLSTSVTPFKADYISPTMLQKLLRQNVYLSACDGDTLYEAGRVSDSFVMVLEGHVTVEFNKEMISFDAGPFTYFGVQAFSDIIGVNLPPTECACMQQNDTIQPRLQISDRKICDHLKTAFFSENRPQNYRYVPDFTVRVQSNLLYLKISRTLYQLAFKTSAIERSKLKSEQIGENVRG